MLAVLGEDYVAGPVSAAGELGVAGDVGNDRLGGAGGVKIAGVVGEALDGGGVANIDVLRVIGGLERDAEGVVEAGGELFDMGGLAVGANATQDEEDTGAGVGQEEISVGRGADEARHGEGARGAGHVFRSVSTLERSVVTTRVEGHLEAGRSDGPRVCRARDDAGSIVDGLLRVWLRQVGNGNLVADSGLLLVPVREGGLASEQGGRLGDGLSGESRRGCNCNRQKCD